MKQFNSMNGKTIEAVNKMEFFFENFMFREILLYEVLGGQRMSYVVCLLDPM